MYKERVSKPEYKAALDSACREYERLLAERADLDTRLAKLQDSIHALTRLCGYEPTVPWGLTDAIRIILNRGGGPMTPLEIRDQLRIVGFDLTRYASELSVIHTTLKRLHKAGELHLVPQKDGVHAYRAARVRSVVLDHLHTFTPGRKR